VKKNLAGTAGEEVALFDSSDGAKPQAPAALTDGKQN
jgi:hypothetical protein